MFFKLLNKENIRKYWFFYICLAVYLIAAFSLYAFSTSPLYPNDYGIDSAIYRYFGRCVLDGQTVYKDVWDNKGPVLYLIQAIGMLRGYRNDKITVIYLMQLAAMFISIGFMWKINNLFFASKRKTLNFIFSLIVTMTYFCAIIDGGNRCEEWSLPMICCSLYYFFRYISKTDYAIDHPIKYAFIHGICFSLIAFISLKNTVTICVGAAIIGIILIIKKQWENLLHNFLAGCLGILIVAIPIFAYFHLKDALDEMLYANFIYNFKYSSSRFVKFTGEEFIIRYAPFAVSYLIIFIHFIKKPRNIRLVDVMTLTLVTSNLLLLIKTNIYGYYFVIYTPILLLTMILYLDFKKTYIPELLIAISIFCLGISKCIELGKVYFRPVHEPFYPTASLYLPKSERDSVIAYDAPAEIYLQLNITPLTRFSVSQTIIFPIEPVFKDEYLDDLYTKNPKWIITLCDSSRQMPEMRQLIEQDYEYRFSDRPVCFYRIKD